MPCRTVTKKELASNAKARAATDAEWARLRAINGGEERGGKTKLKSGVLWLLVTDGQTLPLMLVEFSVSAWKRTLNSGRTTLSGSSQEG